jgi:adenylate cyclase
MKAGFPKKGVWAGLALAFGVLGLSWLGLFDSLNRSFLDGALLRQSHKIQPPQEAVLVLIDEPTLSFMAQTYQQRWPWSRDAFTALFLALHQAGAEQIVVDLMFLENSSDSQADDLLGSVAAAIPHLILAAPKNSLPIFWQSGFSLPAGEKTLEERVGHVDYQADGDGVVRHYLWPDSLAQRASTFPSSDESLLLRWYGGLKELPKNQVLSAQLFLERGYGPNGWWSRLQKEKIDLFDPYQVRAAMDRVPAITPQVQVLKGKTVFVGTNAAATYDVKAIPVSPLEPGVLVHFTAWGNARQNLFIHEMGFRGFHFLKPNGLLAFLVAWIFTAWGWNRPQFKTLAWVTALGLLLTLGLSYFVLPWLFFPPIETVAAFLGALVFLTLRHWMEESRRKREVQELFGSYVSPAVVQQLIEHPESLKLSGEKKELSVYFSDLAGFTDMSETMAPEQLLALMNRYLSEMSEFILEERGYLDKYIGDAIMGVFGAPEFLENHALSACRAALKSRDHLVQLNQELGLKHGKELYARIGINTGEMIVGNLGSGRKRNYTVVGDAVNLASRLEGANKEFGTTILLGMRTEELAREGIVTRPVELLRVKGKKQPVQTYELMALKSGASESDLELSSLFTRAYRSYQQRDFVSALLDFKRAASIRSDDALSRLYVERCQAFQQQPPDPDWDGVFVMKKK